MILQELTQCYEDMLAKGRIARPGWAMGKVSYALVLDDDGGLKQVLNLQEEIKRGKKAVPAPILMEVPAPAKHSKNVAANFLCDNSGYLLGVNNKENSKRSAECFAASRKLHLKLLGAAGSPAARAVVRFFERWSPEQAEAHEALKEDWEGLMKGGNIVFWHGGQPLTKDAAAIEAWQRQYEDEGGEEILCLVTGRREPMARLHPSIKGVVDVKGKQSTGASLVSFNAPAFCSYEHEQGANAPTSSRAAFAYTTALNYLLSDNEHMCRIGDTTVVCWAAGAETAYQDYAMSAIFGDSYEERDILDSLSQLAQGRSINWQQSRLDPEMRFYVLGLAPNAGRVLVRFFWSNSFGVLARNISRHYQRLQIVRPAYDERADLTIWQLVCETMLKPKDQRTNPRLPGDLLQAVLNDGLYPATLLNGVEQRIRAEADVTRGRAAIIKAYYLRNSNDEKLKEVMTVQLNEQSSYMPYVLGRMFAVLELMQKAANPGINTTIKDRYFNAASSMPSHVFPQLINLAQKHIAKMNIKLSVYYDKQLTELMGRITEELPARMDLAEQSAFQIGYYHEIRRQYTKKEDR